MLKTAKKYDLLSRALSFSLKLNGSNLTKHLNVNKSCLARPLYSKASLGIDNYLTQREWTKRQLQNLEDKFKTRMKEYVLSENKNMVFTEDLKNMIHIAENDEDLDLVVKMMKKFNQQNKQIRFGNFVFGTVAMRLFYIHNKPDISKECFVAPELEGFFDQLITYQIFLDLLYENHLYEDVLKYFDIIRQRQIDGAKFPRNSVVLAFAACYKLNNKESAEYALKLWKDLMNSGYYPTRRAVTFCAALLLNQENPEAALEIVSAAKNQRYVSVRNLKLLALVNLRKFEDALLTLKSVISEDSPTAELQTFNRDVIESVEKGLVKCDNPEIVMEFARVKEILTKQKQISNMLLDELLCSEIQKPQDLQNKNAYGKSNITRQRPNNFRYENKFNRNIQTRPGLEDLQ